MFKQDIGCFLDMNRMDLEAFFYTVQSACIKDLISMR